MVSIWLHGSTGQINRMVSAYSDVHNLRTETIKQQYKLVKERTSSDNSYYGSHVMQYKDLPLNKDHPYLYMGTNPANDNFTFIEDNSLSPAPKAVNQRDTDLLHFWHKEN